MSRRVFIGIVLVLIVLIVAINMISSTYNFFSLLMGIPKLIGSLLTDIKSLMS